LTTTEQALGRCTFCPKLCRFSCPVSEADRTEATTPWGKMSVLQQVAQKKLPESAENLALAYKCLNCRLSEEVCELDNPVSPVLDEFRVLAFQKGLAPKPVYDYCRRFQKKTNPYGVDLLGLLEEKFPQKLRSKHKTVYFPGCTEIVRQPQVIEKTLKLFEELGRKDVGLYGESFQCCGYPLYVAGDMEGFREVAEINHHALSSYPTLITGAPACLYTMQTLYAEVGFSVSSKFLHVTEFLSPGFKKLKSSSRKLKASPKKIVYHDPCYLGRYRGIYDEPRKILASVLGEPPQEFFRNKQRSSCCGAGGLLPVSFPETADKITADRIQEFHQTGADLIVSSCPTCVERFKKAGAPCKGLVEFVSETKDAISKK